MMKPLDLEKKCQYLAALNGWMNYRTDGRIDNNVATPDRVFLKNGRGFAIMFKEEFATGAASTIESLKVSEYASLKKCGVPCYFIVNFEDFKRAIARHNGEEVHMTPSLY